MALKCHIQTSPERQNSIFGVAIWLSPRRYGASIQVYEGAFSRQLLAALLFLCGTVFAGRAEADDIGLYPHSEGQEGPWGYIDRMGRTVIHPQFESAERFAEGLAPIKWNGKYGFIEVLHHLPDKGAAARECCRILRAGGHFCMRTCTRDIVYPQSRFFPGHPAHAKGRSAIGC